MSRIVGVDPGVTGGVALIVDGKLEDVEPMPVIDSRVVGGEVRSLLLTYSPDVVVIENTQPMPKNGSIASFKLGLNTGIVVGVATALQMPIVRPRPQVWKREVGIPSGATKSTSRQLAGELYPQFSERFRLVKHDGLAEAVLIARWYGFKSIRLINSNTPPEYDYA